MGTATKTSSMAESDRRRFALALVGVVASVVVLAPEAGAPAGFRTGIAKGAEGCPHVRPGAHIRTSQDSGGPLNFLFRGSDGHVYVGTAGHLLADEETHVWRNRGPTATIDDGTVIGRAVFAWNYNGEDADFALIRIARGVKFSPAMCYWGGPTGINDDISNEPTILRHYGNGMGVRAVAPERTMIAPSLANESMIAACGVAVPGDSGSPVISDDGRALGLQFFLGVLWSYPEDGFTVGNVGIYRLSPQVAAAEKHLGISLRLMEAPLE